jgi:putative DNA primase/helicase
MDPSPNSNIPSDEPSAQGPSQDELLTLASRAIRRLFYGQPPNLSNGAPYGKHLSKLNLLTMAFLEGGAGSVLRLWDTLRNEDAELTAAVEGRFTRVSDPAQIQCTDYGNAERLVLRYGQDIRFCYPLKRWFVWNGKRWVEDTTGEVVRLAKGTVQGVYAEAADTSDRERREKLARWAVQSEGERRIAAMLTLAQSESGVPVLPTQFDADGWLLNVKNGVVDLHTGKLLPHRREDLLTKICPVSYDPEARSDLWDSFLKRILPDEELRSFVQRAMGSSCSGDTSEEKLFFPYGPTSTGKSTFLAAIAAALGPDYATTADFETFLTRERLTGSPRNDIARLAGKRLVISLEVEDGKHLAEALVKQLTGGDIVAARFLYHESFEFLPMFTLWLAANCRPTVRDDDDAIWRRILQIPFTVQIPESERDATVKARLRNPQEAGAAVLAWLVQGCLAWQREGLNVPAAVEQTTDEYRRQMDPVGEYLDECCICEPTAYVLKTRLLEDYQQWARTHGHRRVLGRKDLTERLRKRGFDEGRRNIGEIWIGLKLR